MTKAGRVHPVTKQRSRQLRQNMTDAERLLWRALRKEQAGGYKFRRQHPLGRFILDFVCLDAKLIIEVDGGQHSEQAEYDQERVIWLEEQGFRVLRFWNNDVLSNTEAVTQTIWQALFSGGQPPSQPSPEKGEGDQIGCKLSCIEASYNNCGERRRIHSAQ